MRNEDTVGVRLGENLNSKEWSTRMHGAWQAFQLLCYQPPPPPTHLVPRLLAPLSPYTKALTTLSHCVDRAGLVLASWLDHFPSLLRAFSHAVPFARRCNLIQSLITEATKTTVLTSLNNINKNGLVGLFTWQTQELIASGVAGSAKDMISEHGLPISSILVSYTVTPSPGVKWILVVSGLCHTGYTPLFADRFSKVSGRILICLDWVICHSWNNPCSQGMKLTEWPGPGGRSQRMVSPPGWTESGLRVVFKGNWEWSYWKKRNRCGVGEQTEARYTFFLTHFWSQPKWHFFREDSPDPWHVQNH